MQSHRVYDIAPVLPIAIDEKFVKRNSYSFHDNRYSLQRNGYGESLGKELGKRKLKDKSINQHFSVDLISWKEPQSGKSISSKPMSVSVFKPVTDPKILTATFSPPHNLLNKYHTYTKRHFHRFPHRHHVCTPSHIRPSTQTTDWMSDPPVITPLWVMAATQQPFTSRNSWKCSYKM